jgi:DeoR family transcriptional regulator, fructose operon transcriptional repressor
MTLGSEERRSCILDDVTNNRMVKVTDLSQRFGVSEVVIRRDLERMEKFGLLKRIYGGAVALPHDISLLNNSVTGLNSHEDEKERIGRAAAALIQDGDRIILDSGTTVLQVAQHIAGHLLTWGDLTVITGWLPIPQVLGSWPGMHLIFLGGLYLSQHKVVAGPQTLANLEGLHVDKLFLGANGVTCSTGITTSNVLEAEVERKMVEVANEVIVVADSSKIGVKGLISIVPVNAIHKLFTDTGAPPDFVAEMRAKGIQVYLV